MRTFLEEKYQYLRDHHNKTKQLAKNRSFEGNCYLLRTILSRSIIVRLYWKIGELQIWFSCCFQTFALKSRKRQKAASLLRQLVTWPCMLITAYCCNGFQLAEVWTKLKSRENFRPVSKWTVSWNIYHFTNSKYVCLYISLLDIGLETIVVQATLFLATATVFATTKPRCNIGSTP